MAGRMLEYLGQAVRAARLDAGLRQIDIATTAEVSHVTISALERAQGWSEQLDAIIDAYAAETGCDPIDLWAAAVEIWRRGVDPYGGPGGAEPP